VLQAAADRGKLSIGVDSNQNHLHPGSVLTSMLKRVDVAVYNAFTDTLNGSWQAGAMSLGLAEDGVGFALDEHNRDLVTAEMESLIEGGQGAGHRGRAGGRGLLRHPELRRPPAWPCRSAAGR
jgi:basic membrane protein A